MKRLLKLLARLYPPAWRNRYGAEYEAFLEDRKPRPQDASNVLWGALKMHMTDRSFVRIVLPTSIAGALVAVAISLAVAPKYVSQAVLTATQSAPGPGDDLKPILLALRDGALDRDFLASVIQKYKLYPSERASLPLDKVLGKMLQSIEVRPVQVSPARAASGAGNTSGFVVYFAYPDPHLAQQVENELVSRIVKENLLLSIKSSSEGHPLPPETIRVVSAASLPERPIGWGRIQFSAVGLFAGFLCGLIFLHYLRITFQQNGSQ